MAKVALVMLLGLMWMAGSAAIAEDPPAPADAGYVDITALVFDETVPSLPVADASGPLAAPWE